MPKYIKLFENFIGEASADLLTTVRDTAKVKWTVYKNTLRLSSRKFGKLMFIADAATVKEKGFNLVAMISSANSNLVKNLKGAGGAASPEQNGKLSDLPNGEPDFPFSGRYLFKITEAEGSAKIDLIAELMDGVSPAGSAERSTVTGGLTIDKLFGKPGVEASFDAAVKKAGMKQPIAYIRIVNTPALQVAVDRDPSIKTLLDAQAASQSKEDQAAKEKELNVKVKAALNSAISQESDPAARAELQRILSQHESDVEKTSATLASIK